MSSDTAFCVVDMRTQVEEAVWFEKSYTSIPVHLCSYEARGVKQSTHFTTREEMEA
jgi:hypothetical protein